MSKLLKEGQIRRFMKLANIGTISENFFTEEEEDELGGDEVELDLGVPGEDVAVDDGLGDEAEFEMEEEPGGGSAEEAAVDVITVIADALESEFGLAIEVETGADAGPEDIGLEDDDVVVDDVDLDVAGDELGAEVEPEEELDGLDEIDVLDDDALVAEVLKRVTSRLRSALKKEGKTRIRSGKPSSK